MWADFLSHFTEIGDLEEPVVKQRPNYVPSSMPQADLMQSDLQPVQQQVHQAEQHPFEKESHPEGSSGMSKDGDAEQEDDPKDRKFDRRMSKLDTATSF